MPSEYKQVQGSRFRSGDPLAVPDVVPPLPESLPSSRKRKKRTHESQRRPEFQVYYPCRKCDEFGELKLRLLCIVEDHINLYSLGSKWKISAKTLHLLWYPSTFLIYISFLVNNKHRLLACIYKLTSSMLNP
jgi:hypothetical protein